MRLVFALVLLAALSGPVRAGAAVTADDRAAIQRVIGEQLEAFRRDDGDAALRFAAPALQERFGTGAQFLAIVRHAYAAVVRPRSVTFGDVTDADGEVVQKVELVGADDSDTLALYIMEREPDGTWRIAGCSLIESERLRT